jgi:ADP-ribosyl-[dinitrogen reductase] hydrolase
MACPRIVELIIDRCQTGRLDRRRLLEADLPLCWQAQEGMLGFADMVGGGPFDLKPGQWTDDTSMALALADSLLEVDGFDPVDLMRRFVAWCEEGAYSWNGSCLKIGITVSSALSRWQRTGDPIAGSTDPNSAGNGSLMRMSPVAIRHWQDSETLRYIVALQSRATHGAPGAVSACVAYAELIADAIAGQPRDPVLALRETNHAGRIAEIRGGFWRSALRHDIGSSGYVAHSLETAS